MNADSLSIKPRGHIHIESATLGVIVDEPNVVMNQSLELMVRALLGLDVIDAVVFANSSRALASPGLKNIPGPLATVQAQGEVSQNRLGARTQATWRAVWTPSESQLFDMTGLVTTNRLLFAAKSFSPATVPAGDPIAVRWTVILEE